MENIKKEEELETPPYDAAYFGEYIRNSRNFYISIAHREAVFVCENDPCIQVRPSFGGQPIKFFKPTRDREEIDKIWSMLPNASVEITVISQAERGAYE